MTILEQMKNYPNKMVAEWSLDIDGNLNRYRRIVDKLKPIYNKFDYKKQFYDFPDDIIPNYTFHSKPILLYVMKRIELKQIEHNTQIGDVCRDIEPNVTVDSLFIYDNEVIGFYIKDISKHNGKWARYIAIANKALRSTNVPKSEMKRSSGLRSNENEVLQYSTIIGSVPPKPHMRRPYPTMSSVHNVPSAKTFIEAMLLACRESEELIKQIARKYI